MSHTTQQPPFDIDDLIISSARYYIGRTTAAAASFAAQLAYAWPHLSNYTQGILKRELQQAFHSDDQRRKQRASGGIDAAMPLPLGHDADRQAWEMVRNAWEKEPAPEHITPKAAPQLNLFLSEPEQPENGCGDPNCKDGVINVGQGDWRPCPACNDAQQLSKLLGMPVRIAPLDPNAEQPPF